MTTVSTSQCKGKGKRSRIAHHIEILPKSGIRKFFDLVNSMKDVISLGIGEPDFVTPWTIRETALYSLERGRTSYTSNLGTLSLRKAICRYVENAFGASYDPADQCLVTVGVSEALDLCMRAILEPGDEVIYHEPCYVSYPAEIRMAYGVPVPIPTYAENRFSLDPALVEKAVTRKTKAILLNFPCNPTGAVLSMADMKKIAATARKHDLLVLADHIYSELTYDTEMEKSIASLPGMAERTVFLHGFSKAFAMTGLRLGYACGPRDVIEAMMKIHQYSILCAPTTAQDAAEEALLSAHGDMEEMRNEYRTRRGVIVKRLNEIGLKCLMPSGAFYVFPDIRSTGLSSQDFAMRLLEEERVAVVPGTAFGECGEGYVRCSYATSLAQIHTAMDRIEHFVKNLKKPAVRRKNNGTKEKK